MKKIVILGAGVTGLTIAKELSEQYGKDIIVLEKESYIGGLAATLSSDGLTYDLGSHRIHLDYPKRVLRYLTDSLGVELMKRPRRGALYLFGKFIRYPANIFNFLRTMPLRQSLDFFISYVINMLLPFRKKIVSYEDVMIKTVGKKIYLNLYKDFARKLWGMDPALISVEGMKRRNVTINFKTIKKALLRQDKHFYYPKHGTGEIAEKLAQKAIQNRVTIVKKAKVERIVLNENKEVTRVLGKDSEGQAFEIETSLAISTIPIDSLYELIHLKAPAASLKWRGILLLYLHLKEPFQRDNDTFYFPELNIKFGRVSNINKFSPYLNSSIEGAFLTIEFPCSPGEDLWSMPEEELVNMCIKEMVHVGIYLNQPTVIKHFSIRLEKAYPIYDIGWEEKFGSTYAELRKIKGLYSLGRRGLFLHSNIDHAIVQGLELSEYILQAKEEIVLDKKVNSFRKFSARD